MLLLESRDMLAYTDDDALLALMQGQCRVLDLADCATRFPWKPKGEAEGCHQLQIGERQMSEITLETGHGRNQNQGGFHLLEIIHSRGEGGGAGRVQQITNRWAVDVKNHNPREPRDTKHNRGRTRLASVTLHKQRKHT